MSKVKCKKCGNVSEMTEWKFEVKEGHTYTTCPYCGEIFLLVVKKDFNDKGEMVRQGVMLYTEEEMKSVKRKEN